MAGYSSDEWESNRKVESDTDEVINPSIESNAIAPKTDVFNLRANNGETSSSEEGDDSSTDEGDTDSEGDLEVDRQQLPSAHQALATPNVSTIFSTQYAREEEADRAVLERHVKLTDDRTKQDKDNRKRTNICRQFKKGRCRRGDQCKLSHVLPDQRLREERRKTPAQRLADTRREGMPKTEYSAGTVAYGQLDEQPITKKRKKVGVTNSLVPPKKAMNRLTEQSREEQPWMDKQKKK